MKYPKCVYPGCTGNIIPNREKKDLCEKHEELMNFILWSLNNIKIKDPSKIDSGLILPK